MIKNFLIILFFLLNLSLFSQSIVVDKGSTTVANTQHVVVGSVNVTSMEGNIPVVIKNVVVDGVEPLGNKNNVILSPISVSQSSQVIHGSIKSTTTSGGVSASQKTNSQKTVVVSPITVKRYPTVKKTNQAEIDK